jgi:acyl-CoA reductase-like NAD-dependent aldehyde dehydrogenase
LRNGQVDINAAPFNLRAPFGGYNQSGIGREIGDYGIEDVLEIKVGPGLSRPTHQEKETGIWNLA